MTMLSTADSVLRAIGRTPLIRLRRMVPAGAADVIVKLESVNPTGSYKDRMALAMIEGAEARGVLRPGVRVVEFTGGSTGSSLARGMADVYDPYLVRLHTIVYLVWMTDHQKLVDARVFRHRRNEWEVGQQPDSSLNGNLDRPAAGERWSR